MRIYTRSHARERWSQWSLTSCAIWFTAAESRKLPTICTATAEAGQPGVGSSTTIFTPNLACKLAFGRGLHQLEGASKCADVWQVKSVCAGAGCLTASMASIFPS